MTKINKNSTWVVEGVVPAVIILILLRFLNPFEGPCKRFIIDFAIAQLGLVIAIDLRFLAVELPGDLIEDGASLLDQ